MEQEYYYNTMLDDYDIWREKRMLDKIEEDLDFEDEEELDKVEEEDDFIYPDDEEDILKNN